MRTWTKAALRMLESPQQDALQDNSLLAAEYLLKQIFEERVIAWQASLDRLIRSLAARFRVCTQVP
jgi:hypothetical protein